MCILGFKSTILLCLFFPFCCFFTFSFFFLSCLLLNQLNILMVPFYFLFSLWKNLQHQHSPGFVQVNNPGLFLMSFSPPHLFSHKILSVLHEQIELLEGNISKSFSDINLSNIFLDRYRKAKEIKAKINKWDLKTFTMQRKPTTKPIAQQKISANYVTNKGLIFQRQKYPITQYQK